MDEDTQGEEHLWRCWQCGHYYYPNSHGLEDPLQPVEPLPESSSPSSQDHRRGRKRKRYAGLAERDINSVILRKGVSDERWWARNRQIIAYLDEGRTVREIAMLMERGQRQIRVIRERLVDVRDLARGEDW